MAKNKPAPKSAPQPQGKRVTPVNKADALKTELATPATGTKLINERLLLLILVGLAFLVNLPTLAYDYTLDDPFFTKDNPLVKQGISALPELFRHAAYYGVFKNHDASYRPFLLASFAIEKQFFGFNPMVSHLVNLLLFSLQVFFLYKLLRKILITYSPLIPFFIILLFELHPIHTEVVASIKSRDEIIALMFTSICTLHSFNFVDTEKKKYLVYSGLFFFFALMSKETPITFVGIMPMSLYFFRNVPVKKMVVACIPYLIVAAIYMAMRSAFIESDGQKVRILVNNNALMAAQNGSDKMATALFIQLKYLVLLIFPHPLSYDYSYNQIPIIGFSNPAGLFSLLVAAALLGLGIYGVNSKNIYSYCILLYLGQVVLTSNLVVDIGATMAERFVYSASLGFCMAIVFLLAKLLKANPTTLTWVSGKKLLYVIVPIAVLYAGKTMARNQDWKNNLALYESGYESSPNSWRTNNLLGVTYTKMISGEKDPAVKKELSAKAIDHFNKSLAVLKTPEVYLLKGYAFDFLGNVDSAIASYHECLTLDSTNHDANNNLGTLYLRAARFPEAIAVLSREVARDTTHTDAMSNLAAAYGNSGHFDLALHYYEMALRINPDQPTNVFMSMTNIYHYLGDSVNTQRYRQLLLKKKQQGE